MHSECWQLFSWSRRRSGCFQSEKPETNWFFFRENSMHGKQNTFPVEGEYTNHSLVTVSPLWRAHSKMSFVSERTLPPKPPSRTDAGYFFPRFWNAASPLSIRTPRASSVIVPHIAGSVSRKCKKFIYSNVSHK